MRLAWFSPMPPVRTGVATYSAELVRALEPEHDIDVYVDGSVTPPPSPARSRSAGPRPAHDFVWTHRQRPYDLVVYQIGNSSHHDYAWPYLFRFPGLTVLHDAHLHHARAAALLRERRPAHYRAEFAGNAPGASPDAAELAIAGFDSFLHYEWPFTRLVVSASRATAVHSRVVRDELRGENPSAVIEHVRLGHGTLIEGAPSAERRARGRARAGIPPDAVVFGVFGGLTPEKRLPQILHAFRDILRYAPGARLLLAGAPAAHYDVAADIAALGLNDRVVLTGYLPEEDDLTDCIAASDVALNLRWPTAREISGPWVRCLGAGRPTVVMDLLHTADAPSLDPRTWSRGGGDAPVCVAIDIMDEDHSLRLAMRRLALDAALRDELGAAARAYWVQQHAQPAMMADYRRLLVSAAAQDVPSPALPPHLKADESGLTERLLRPFGVSVPWSKI